MQALTAETEGARAGSSLSELSRDVYESFKAKGFWLYSAWIEVLLGYRSTVLGPLWMTIGTAFFVFVVGGLFKKMIVPGEGNLYIAHLAVGYVFWQYIRANIAGSARFFQSNSSGILDGAASYTDILLKETNKNFIILLHNAIVIILAFPYAGVLPSALSFMLLFTIPLVIANIFWVTVVISILGARYSDLVQIIKSIMRLMFFITPILWVAGESARGPFVDAVLYINPFYYLIEVVRAPLVYGQIPYFELAVLIIALPTGWLIASLLYTRARSVIALWL